MSESTLRFLRDWAVGSIVGLAFAAALILAGVAEGQTGICAQGRECTVNSLTTTSVPRNATGLSGSNSVRLGSFSSTTSGVWMTVTAPSTTNYALASDGTSLTLNTPGGGNLNVNSGGTTPIAIWSSVRLLFQNGYLRFTGVATGSLPTCNAGAAGSIHYDTTTTTVKWCNGSTWQSFGTSSADTTTGSYFATCTTCADATVFRGAFRPDTARTAQKITCTAGTAGTGGTTGTTIAVRNLSDGTDTVSCAIPCTTGTTGASCTLTPTALASDKNHGLRISAEDCTTDPQPLDCNVTYAQ
jgi:hypothetical protein